MISQICSKGTHYFRINEYYNIAEQSVYENIMERFERDFQYLKYMIKNKHLYTSAINKNTTQLNKWRINNNGIEIITKYFTAKKKVLLRTRNYNTKAVVHNSNIEILRKIVSILLKNNIMVLNIGVPFMPLHINSVNYYELSHNLNFEEELLLCEDATANLMSAEAGLFVAFAASDINLIQYDTEWSVAHCEIPVSLMDARRDIEMNDLNIIDIHNDEVQLENRLVEYIDKCFRNKILLTEQFDV